MDSLPSSSSSHTRRYHGFPSFHGPDVRKKFLSHLHNHFESKGIIAFKDQSIERGHTIGPELVQAIRESRVSIVVLSKKYASSTWCLDELVEILKCKEASGQIVMTIFYDVDPWEKKRWTEALAYVATIAGEHSLNWEDEAAMIEKIVMDVSKKLDVTLSRDFEWMVGMEAHLKKLNSILCLEYDKVKMIGIWGPAGIGKTTIARALYDQLSGSFPFICFMGSYTSIMGVDEHDSKLLLQNKLLSKILNRSDMSVNHLGAIKEWLHDKRVFIILDDVDDLEKLETLAKERTWFGLGSRIIVTTEDKKILKAHGINDIYHVDFPSEKEALEILCLSAFKQSYVQDGFEELANKVAEFCGNLPLGLCIVGSSLRGESKDEWELQLSRIETSLDRKVEDILRVGYDRLSDKAQSLFLHITCFFFDGKDVDYVTAMLADTTLDVKNGLKILAEKSLIYISFHGLIGMHYLLQQLGKQIVLQQSNEPGKRQFLVEFEEIRDVLKNETGTGSVIGISFDMYKIGKLFISKGAFKGMRNLKFLRIYNGKVTLLEDMEYLPHLRLLHWDTYPRKSLPPTFDPELLVELHMPNSNLEKLWGGIQPLANLMKIDLTLSSNLKEIPNLLKATSLETLQLSSCKSLLELPSSISNLHKLKKLSVRGCYAIEVIPTNINLALLEEVDMGYCSSLRTFPDLSSNIYRLDVSSTKIEDVPSPVVGRWSHLRRLNIGDSSLKRLAHLPKMVRNLDLRNTDIRKIPDCVIGLHHLEYLTVKNCQKLVSIPGLAPSLESLNANNCQSLKRVYPYFYNPIRELMFYNCLDLDEEARRRIIQQSFYEHICLPGREIPAEFTHKALGTSITIPLAPDGEGNFVVARGFKACVLLSKTYRRFDITCCIRSKRGVLINEVCSFGLASSGLYSLCLSTHLYIFGEELFQQSVCHDEVDLNTSEVHFEFTVDMYDNCEILECGVKILTEETEGITISSKGG
ncbi:Toll/interleukin-1 receptor homology (TIR) domain [Arabidopsis thaliana x Arabidopsis arenosa]|uniref:Toll/interleukin-1 receptor homology (TIR) domain n=1 Tax=Arabidopsis thaliana x Arabidopsis arenosa TaxID=1240361 RepID=A0A8T2C4F3_9BRAS|nr:Toll/interleukin-1 receptor homology (TIR) domain [Arabidopsis thaliana x Arabidopsis arenosa]